MASQQLTKHIVRRFEKGTYLLRQHETTRDLYIIRFGLVRVFKTEGGLEIELDSLGPGGVVGEISAIDGEPRSASAIALEETEVVLIPGEEFARVVATFPEWFGKISKILVQRLRDVNEKIDFSKGGDKLAHVAAMLTTMSHSVQGVKAHDAVCFNESVVQSDLAMLMNMLPSEVNDCITRLAKVPLLSLEKGKIIVTDMAKLRALGDTIYRGIDTALPT